MFSIKSPLQQTNSYLPHIDGIRAIAVLSVLFFHVDINLFSGGYVGVDIFFVISGCLITTHLVSAIAADNFTFKNFYNRRARRLLPALLTTIALTFISGIIIFPAPNLERLANSSIFSLFSVSNIFFWSESGYFDADASLKPLLHIWSLSVEEQFYLVWPAFLLLICRKRFTPVYIVLAGLLSLIACEYIMVKDAAAAFFLTPFRIVEFGIGGMLAWLNIYKPGKNVILELISLLGFIFIGIAVFGYSEQTRFPGLSSLLPCIGAALLIYAGEAKFSGLILRNTLMVTVGLVSYSLYLVHWPVVVFYKYYKLAELTPVEQSALLGVSFILSLFIYLFIERPFRAIENRSYKIPSQRFFRILGAGCTCLLVLTAYVSYDNGCKWRFNRSQLSKTQIDQGMEKRIDIYREICTGRGWENCAKPSSDKSRNVLVIGDSHAVDGLNIFYQAYPDFHYTMMELGGCPPLTEDDASLLSPDHPDREKCLLLNIDRFGDIEKNQYHAIIISVLFDWYKPENLMHAISRIKEKSDAMIIVLGNYIQLKNNFSDLINKDIEIDKHQELVYSFALYEDQLKAMAPGNFIFISKKALLCGNGNIESCNFWFDDIPFTYDQHHLSYEASSYLARQLSAQYPDLLNQHKIATLQNPLSLPASSKKADIKPARN